MKGTECRSRSIQLRSKSDVRVCVRKLFAFATNGIFCRYRLLASKSAEHNRPFTERIVYNRRRFYRSRFRPSLRLSTLAREIRKNGQTCRQHFGNLSPEIAFFQAKRHRKIFTDHPEQEH